MCSSVIACMLVGVIGAGQGAAPGAEARSARLAHQEIGTTLVAQGKWDEAIEHLRKGLDLYPADGTMRYLLGYSYSSKAYQSGDLKLLEIAITHYQAALQAQPRLAEAFNELGTAQRTLGQRDQAIASYRQALAINPNWMLPRFNLGEAYSDKGSYAQALAEFRWLLKHFTDAPSSGISLAQIQNAIGEAFDHSDKLEEAATSFKAALADDPAFTRARLNLAGIYLQQRRLDDAVGEYEHAIRLDAGNADLEYAVSQLYALQRKDDLALGALERAVQKGFEREAIRRNTLFWRLRKDPRFIKLLQ